MCQQQSGAVLYSRQLKVERGESAGEQIAGHSFSLHSF